MIYELLIRIIANSYTVNQIGGQPVHIWYGIMHGAELRRHKLRLQYELAILLSDTCDYAMYIVYYA